MEPVAVRPSPKAPAAADNGYFPHGTSVLRRVHEQRAVGLLYGQRALGIGAIAPLNFVGTRLHTRAPDKPFNRLAHTGKMFETIFSGTRADADRVLELVNRLHQDVHGSLPEDAGPFPAGIWWPPPSATESPAAIQSRARSPEVSSDTGLLF